MESSRHKEVKGHYRRLAPEYSSKANQTCEAVYERLARRFLFGLRDLLELGSGSGSLLDRLESQRAVACDLSEEMLRSRAMTGAADRVVAAGERLPFANCKFDGVFCINVLEHVADVDLVMDEVARVLEPGGRFLAVTPNGNWEYWLDLAERHGMKIPEGPHTFLTTERLAQAARSRFEIREHRTMLSVPVGGPRLASLIDRLTGSSAFGWGFFQYLVAEK